MTRLTYSLATLPFAAAMLFGWPSDAIAAPPDVRTTVDVLTTVKAPETGIVAIYCGENGIGTGVYLESGRVVTALHVVEGCAPTDIKIVFPTRPLKVAHAPLFSNDIDGYTIAATPYKCKASQDIAILKPASVFEKSRIHKYSADPNAAPAGVMLWLQSVDFPSDAYPIVINNPVIYQGQTAAAVVWEKSTTYVGQISAAVESGHSGGAVIYNNKLVGIIVARDASNPNKVKTAPGEEKLTGYLVPLTAKDLSDIENDQNGDAQCSMRSPKYSRSQPTSSKACDYSLVRLPQAHAYMELNSAEGTFDFVKYVRAYVPPKYGIPEGVSYSRYEVLDSNQNVVLRIILPDEETPSSIILSGPDCSWSIDAGELLLDKRYESRIKVTLTINPVSEKVALFGSRNELCLASNVKRHAYTLKWIENGVQVSFDLELETLDLYAHNALIIRRIAMAWLNALLLTARNVLDLRECPA